MPGVGFDVVPTDCLGAHLAERLPDADRFERAFRAENGVSRGTAKTMVEHISGGAVRRDGTLGDVLITPESRTVEFGWGQGSHHVAAIPSGNISTGHHTAFWASRASSARTWSESTVEQEHRGTPHASRTRADRVGTPCTI